MKRIVLLCLLLSLVVVIFSVSVVGAAPKASKYIVVSPSRFGVPASLIKQIQAAGGTVVRNYARAGLLVVSTANPNFESRVRGAKAIIPNILFRNGNPRIEVGPAINAGSPPSSGDDDFFFDLQWGHNAVDSQGGWAAGRDGTGAIIAVLDEGVDADHPDLGNVRADLSTSFAEDCVGGIEDWNPEPGFYFNHGTHVAGIAAAQDNAFGVIGVAPGAQIMAVGVLSRCLGFGQFDWVISGMIYAAEHGADVINMSLGALFDISNPVDFADAADVGLAMSAAALYANSLGTTVIASAGNSGVDFDAFPNFVSLPSDALGVISIAATAPEGWAIDPSTNLDILSSFSNHGKYRVDFTAPGGDFDLPGDDVCTVAGVTRFCWIFDMVFSTIPGGWGWAAGTSMAAPHAAGVAAQYIGYAGGSLAPDQVFWGLRQLADDLGPQSRDNQFSIGRVDATVAD